ncbi:TPA: CopG family transcriptional regulator [Clostridium perfringens]|uniref:CopG family transcriptional regulator n=1 Tax=Clostridium perfringens TaxID=1502 RepID=UPI001A3540E7|nr:CopG family transcriptional regulator [Clostridium perfringens]UBK70127.1 CopG family transcriptional regulator [Clostridium perfringens]UBK72715.1 CopG family transcriptional regulator [Clostridium perfringens]HAT4186843.1 CopG family transcriptional regulator [Clostridium perfringens]HAT4189440.1 CopG family transcriptional regulator [Clostridium perfringens]HAT4194707.1 CopG family transcriptional regulator [Clostridium perfringens]
MSTKIKKDEFIKVRVTKEQKDLFRKVAKELGITMTDLLVVGTEEFAKSKLETLKSRKKIEARALKMENQIQVLKQRLANRKSK